MSSLIVNEAVVAQSVENVAFNSPDVELEHEEPYHAVPVLAGGELGVDEVEFGQIAEQAPPIEMVPI